MLGGNGICDGEGLVGSIHQHAPPSIVKGGGDLVAARRRRDDPVNLRLDGLGHRFVPGDEPCQATGAVLGLDYDVDGGEGRRDGGIGHHHDLGGSCERRGHAHVAGHLALGQGHVDVSRSGDHVHCGDAGGAVRHCRHRLGTTDRVDDVDARHGRSGEGHVSHPTVRTRGHAEHYHAHPGHTGRYGGHQDGGWVGGPTTGCVATGTLDRPADRTDAQPVLVGTKLRTPLALVVATDGGRRELQGLEHDRVDPGRCRGDVLRIHDDVFQIDPVVPDGEVSQGGVAAFPDVGDDRPHVVQRTVRSGRRLRQDRSQVSEGAAEVQTPEHPATLPAGGLGIGRDFACRWTRHGNRCRLPPWTPVSPPNSPRSQRSLTTSSDAW